MGNASGGNATGGFGGGVPGGAAGSAAGFTGGRSGWRSGPRADETRRERMEWLVHASPSWRLRWRMGRAAKAGCRAAKEGLPLDVGIRARGALRPVEQGSEVRVEIVYHAQALDGAELGAASARFRAAFERYLRRKALVVTRDQ